MAKFYAHITYTDRFVVEAENKSAARDLVRQAWRTFGAQYDKLRLEPAPDNAPADPIEETE